MKKVNLILVIILLKLTAFAQINLEGQIGGSNFLGASINASLDILHSKDGNKYFTPSIGIGMLVPGWDEPTSIIHFGLNYQLKNWGFGGELSRFSASPIFGTGYTDFVDMIVYPNINYTIFGKSNWYYKFSAGAYFAFSDYGNYGTGKANIEFDGDVIPGIGISIGYKFKTKNI